MWTLHHINSGCMFGIFKNKQDAARWAALMVPEIDTKVCELLLQEQHEQMLVQNDLVTRFPPESGSASHARMN